MKLSSLLLSALVLFAACTGSSVTVATRSQIDAASIAALAPGESIEVDLTANASYLIDADHGAVDLDRIELVLPGDARRSLADMGWLPDTLTSGQVHLRGATAATDTTARAINNGRGTRLIECSPFGCICTGEGDCNTLITFCTGKAICTGSGDATSCYCTDVGIP